MKPTITLGIDKPCSEKFDNFKTTKAGGFCGSCQTEVIDFTQMTDKEIILYFQNNQKKSCGRFNETQLKTYSTVLPSKRMYSLKKIGIGLMSFSLLSILAINKSQAQQTTPTAITETSKNTENKQTTTTDNEEITITGNVTCSDGSLPGATIQIKGTARGAVTDIDGNFSLVVPNREIILVVSFVGYDRKEIQLKDTDSNFLQITLGDSSCQFFMVGEVSINEVYQSKQTVWQKFKSLFR